MKKVKILNHCSGSEINENGITLAPRTYSPGEEPTVGDALAKGLIESGDAIAADDFQEAPAAKAMGRAQENKSEVSPQKGDKRRGKG